MALITDKIAIGKTSLSDYALDVSGNIQISSLSGVGVRVLVPDINGNLSTAAAPGGTVDETGLVSIMFGDGSNGDVSIASGVTTLTKEMNYNNLTLMNGATLNTAGYIVRVKGVLTMNAYSYISCDGSNGANAAQAVRGIGGGSTMSAARYPWQCVPGTGGNGGQCTSSGTANSAWGSGSTTIAPSYFGGVGGAGGGGGAHGSATGATAPTNGSTVWGGWNGVRGASAGTTGTGYASGGGGGGGGGFCAVFAREVSLAFNNAGYIQANGGNGGNGYYSASNVYGGGGGGGTGGIALFVYQYNPKGYFPYVRSTGGSVGSYGTGGENGYNGDVRIYKINSPEINISPTSRNFTSSGGTQAVNVTSNLQSLSWQANENQSWLSISSSTGTGDGSFTINCDQQPNGGSGRSATITVLCTNNSKVTTKYFSVTQDSSAVAATLGYGSYYSTSYSDTYDYYTTNDWCMNPGGSIDVSSNGNWTISPAYGQNNFNISQYSGSAGNTSIYMWYTGLSNQSASWTVYIGATAVAYIYVNSQSGC